jgi:hypothetical protein
MNIDGTQKFEPRELDEFSEVRYSQDRPSPITGMISMPASTNDAKPEGFHFMKMF